MTFEPSQDLPRWVGQTTKELRVTTPQGPARTGGGSCRHSLQLACGGAALALGARQGNPRVPPCAIPYDPLELQLCPSIRLMFAGLLESAAHYSTRATKGVAGGKADGGKRDPHANGGDRDLLQALRTLPDMPMCWLFSCYRGLPLLGRDRTRPRTGRGCGWGRRYAEVDGLGASTT